LVELKAVEVEIAAAPADQRDALRKTQTEGSTTGSMSASASAFRPMTRTRFDCLIAAKSAAQAHACTK